MLVPECAPTVWQSHVRVEDFGQSSTNEQRDIWGGWSGRSGIEREAGVTGWGSTTVSTPDNIIARDV